MTYQIVGDDEADLKHGKILGELSNRAGADRQGRRRHRRGACPGGVREYEVLAVRYS